MAFRWSAAGLALVLAVIGCDKPSADPKPAAVEDDVAVYFSPETNCENLIANLVKRSGKSVWVQAYSFRSEVVAKALVSAKKRGVDVKVILDSDKAEDKSKAKFLSHRGIATYIDDKHTKAHNKIILIDGETIITGSYNLTPEEEQDPKADNVLVITNHPKLMDKYSSNFKEHLEHSELKD
jgi:phosphatidylserine/phosphatidylglycerophosphate/cardiolipin synthase-like enzyme